ncbi:MAG TPA: DUF3568 family protein [Verrucomicrobiae bacterium]|nr:DUF3568 family protein [Verrucomicrobiae bacterium]
MKTKILTVFAGIGAILLAVGCVRTVSGTRTAAMSPGEDSYTGKYERTPDQVYQASLNVLKNNGVVEMEYKFPQTTNGVENIKAVSGRVNQRKVWIRVEPVDPKITEVTVQVRTVGGFRDQDLAHELEKEIALQLQLMR